MNLFANLCKDQHPKIMSGTCPWCGWQVVRGVVVSTSPSDGTLDQFPLVVRFVAWLGARGMRITKQRLAIIKLLSELKGVFDAESLLEQLPGKGKANYVSRPSVYRTVAELVESGLLSKSEINDRVAYRLEC